MENLHSRNHPRAPLTNSGEENSPRILAKSPPPPVAVGSRASRRRDSVQSPHPRPPLTPINTLPPPSLPNPLPSAPASPPTPAPSPTPHHRAPTWPPPREPAEDPILRDARLIFSQLNRQAREAWLTSIVDICSNHTLSFLHHLVSPRLKKDPFGGILPIELCFKVCICKSVDPRGHIGYLILCGADSRVCGRPENLGAGISGV
jgi:F-box and WD-40 domain protein CDC4